MKKKKDKLAVRWGIKLKLISTVMILMVVFLSILTWVQILSQKTLLEKELNRRIVLMRKNLIAVGKNIAINITQQVEIDIASYNLSGIVNTIKQNVKNNKNLVYVILTDSSNTVFAHTLRPDLVRTRLTDEKDIQASQVKELTVRELKKDQESFSEIINPVQISTAPWGVLRLFFSMKYLDKEIKLSEAKIKNERNQMILKALRTSLLFLAVSFIIVFILSSKILKPLMHLTYSTRKLSKGDFTHTIKIDAARQDEIGRLLEDVKNMVDNLRDMIIGISETACKVDSFSGDILNAVENQAIISAQQSASVTEISSTMAELATSSTNIADNSKSVAQIGDHALNHTKEGAKSVENIMIKMNEININNQKNIQQIAELGRKSEDIAKIMEIINAISDQTKLIAFNAALEASSAGEAGKRFSVVAAEIRRLAGSVTESTGDIENKVNEIREAVSYIIINSEKGSKQIQEGLEYSNKTSLKLNEIVESVQASTDASKQISLSIQQQKTANEQVVASLKDIEQGSKQTLSAIKHISEISKDMKTLSDDLQNLMKKFKLIKN